MVVNQTDLGSVVGGGRAVREPSLALARHRVLVDHLTCEEERVRTKIKRDPKREGEMSNPHQPGRLRLSTRFQPSGTSMLASFFFCSSRLTLNASSACRERISKSEPESQLKPVFTSSVIPGQVKRIVRVLVPLCRSPSGCARRLLTPSPGNEPPPQQTTFLLWIPTFLLASLSEAFSPSSAPWGTSGAETGGGGGWGLG